MTVSADVSDRDITAPAPRGEARSGARHRVRALVVLAALVAVAYGGSLRNGFVFDDAIFVERDERLQSIEGVRRLFTEPLWGFSDPHGQRGTHQYYRPLQLLAPAASKMRLGGAAWPVHLLSLLLHLGCALMVYELLLRVATRVGIGSSSGDASASPLRASTMDRTVLGVALVLSALFAVHPANSEAVLWASDLSGLGATACILAVVLVHGRRQPRPLDAFAIAALSFAAMLFKESGALAPLLMVLHDVCLRARDAKPDIDATTALGRPARRGVYLAANYAAAAAALAAYLALRVHALGGLLPGADRLELGPGDLVLNAIALVPSYVRSFVWPFELNMYRDFDLVRGLGDPRLALGALLVAAWLAMSIAWRRHGAVVFGLAWSAVAAAPWLVVRWPQLNVFAERYLYLPSIGIYAALIPPALWLARESTRLTRAAALCAAALVAAFVLRDVLRTRDWRDEVTIYTKTLAQSPRAELIRNNLALRYLASGKPELGIPIQEELLRMDADFPSGWHNLGLLMLAVGRNDDARTAFEKSAALEPRNAATALNLGYVYDLGGEREKAVEQYFIAAMLDPRDAKAWYNLAVIAYERGQLANARDAATKVLSRTPNDTVALALLKQIATRAPTAAEADPATVRRCNEARAALQQGRAREAIAKLEAAAWLDERAALPHHYLANVRYLAGAYRAAYEHEREAYEREPKNALYRANVMALEKLLRNMPSTRPQFDTATPDEQAAASAGNEYADPSAPAQANPTSDPARPQ